MSTPHFLRVAYVGTGFHGWQIQTSLRTAQGELWDALRKLEPGAPLPQGTGRTDAGVHARDQGVLAHLGRPWEGHRLLAALNAHLPWDLRVQEAGPAPEGFFPRQHAVAKRYVYRVRQGAAADPFQTGRVWHVHGSAPLDLEAMERAGGALLGTRDFSSFRCAECVAESPVRSLYRFDLRATPGGMDLVFEGNRFLMHQVRIMTGTLVEVGKGRRSWEAIPALLEARQRALAGPTAPPQGLCLDQVWYEKSWGLGPGYPLPSGGAGA
ncbi:MAG: tRNA pseudouridine(38-40) synthase TruA [Acidobacteria bacterium]|nr:tRNA pseudouridine(38-40) synthase TruA [Acidobacteriota bacterium]